MKVSILRRRMILGAASALLTSAALGQRLLSATPRQMLGPFYPTSIPLDNDNDLTRVHGRNTVAKGSISEITGRLLDVNGRPIINTRIEIWQCDALGYYHHSRDQRGPGDENFQGFGHATTDLDGRYRFRTIRPVPYPGRAPHIHFAVRSKAAEPFITQLYIKDDERNASDFLFNDLSTEKQSLVLAEFKSADGIGMLNAHFDIVLIK